MKRSGPVRAWRLSRAGGGLPNPQTLTQRARTFAAAAGQVGQATLVTTRDAAGLSHFVVFPDRAGADQAALHLAQTVAASAVEADVPSLAAPVVGWLEVKSGTVASRDTQAGSDPAEVARRLAVAMRPGGWVAAVLRDPSRGEVRRVRRWYEHRLGTKLPVHHTSDDQTVVMSLWAGGATVDEVRGLLIQVAAALPGFDVDTRPRVASLTRSVLPWSAASVAVWATTLMVSGHGPVTASLLSAPLAAIAYGTATGTFPSTASKAAAASATGVLPPPARRTLPAFRPRTGTTQPGGATSSSDGSYPLASSAFLVGPAVIVGLVAPHAGGASGASTTETRPAPSALLKRVGPAIGTTGDGTLIHLSASAMDGTSGVGIVGAPGSGKSALLRSIYGWYCLERARPTGTPGWPGANNTLVAFESKGDGATMYQRWAEATGDRTLIVEVADPESWAIDLFAIPGTAAERANFITNALQYTFGSDAIQDRSFETLTNVLTAALVVDDSIATQAHLPVGMSPFFYAHILLGGQGDTKGGLLAAAISEAAARAERAAGSRALPSGAGTGPERGGALTELGVADERLAPYYAGKATESSRRTFFEAPRNKIGQLLAAESWWSPQRRKVTWDLVLDRHRSIVVNTGVTRAGQIVEDRLSAQMGSLLLFTLRDAIMRRCSGWQAENRYVTIFADELSLVAGSSPEVVTWLRNQGRSYGVRPVFATQYPEQLSRDVRTAFMSFGTFLWFTQQTAEIAAAAAADLSLGGDEWTAADVASLEKHTAVLRATVDQQRQPSVPLRVTYWEGDMSGFASNQGWD